MISENIVQFWLQMVLFLRTIEIQRQSRPNYCIFEIRPARFVTEQVHFSNKAFLEFV